jgi:NhaP-type Na+/H+ or K+/H+ antiporter
LLIGMPLTALAIAATAHALLALRWLSALLVGAILSPTDPVFASAIIGREEIPYRVTHLLNVESGLNDGLALPFVIVLLAAQSHATANGWRLIGEALGGFACGAIVAGVSGGIRNLRVFSVAASQEALVPFAIAIVILATARAIGWNEYLAAYAGGITLATISPKAREEFEPVGERLGEVLKLAAVLLVAITMSIVSEDVPLRDYAFAAFVLTFARTAAIGIALLGSRLTWEERLVAAWFGPKGFASVIYGLMLLRSGIPGAEALFQLVGVTIVLSIVLHSSTDVPVAHYFGRRA